MIPRLVRLLLVPAVLLLPGAAAAQVSGPQGIEIRGHLTPKRYTTLASELAAKVDKVTVREGDRFRDGQLLLALDCSVQRAQLDRARSVLATAAKLEAAQRRLVELKTAGELDAEQAALEVAKAKGEAEVMAATVAKCTIAAPFSGRVSEQKVRDQQFVQAGQPLLEVLDDSVLEMEFIVPSKWLAWLKVGMPFQFQIDELGGRVVQARVARLGAQVDPVSQSVKVAGEIVGGAADLVAGMSGRVLLAPPN
jgi:RND family efflux transporter MFP subunit